MKQFWKDFTEPRELFVVYCCGYLVGLVTGLGGMTIWMCLK
jgi:hypothetical protein